MRTGEYVASAPGDFRFPGRVNIVSPSVPRARPAAATPSVLTAQSFSLSARSPKSSGKSYSSNMVLTLLHHAAEVGWS